MSKSIITPETTIADAKRISDGLVDRERPHFGGNVEPAIHAVAQKYGVAKSHINSLWHRWRDLKSIPAHVLEQLREIEEAMYERARQWEIHEREVSRRTAASLDPDISKHIIDAVCNSERERPPEDTR